MTQVHTFAETSIPGKSLAEVFDYCTSPTAAVEFFPGYGPIPAIRAVVYRPGHAAAVGAVRDVELADGSRLEETIVAWQPPTLHAYRVSGFAAPLRWLSRTAEGRYLFRQLPAGAQRPATVVVRWEYTYWLTSVVAWPLAAVIVKGLMRPAMARALDRIAAHFA